MYIAFVSERFSDAPGAADLSSMSPLICTLLNIESLDKNGLTYEVSGCKDTGL